MATDSKPSIHCKNCPAWSKSVFSGLSHEQLDNLQKKKTSLEVGRGAFFNRKGAPTDGAHCLARGSIKVSWPAGEKESIVKIASAGDMAGYRCLFSETHFRGTAIALEPIQACYIPKEVLFELVETDPGFAREMLGRMGREVAAAEMRLHSFCQKNVRERLAEALLLLQKNCGVEKDGCWVLEIHLTRQEISSWIGTAKETVVRTLSDFKEEGVLAQGDSYLTLLDLEKLRQIAGLS